MNFMDRGVLAHFPSKARSLGLLTGVVAAIVITPLMFAIFRVLGSAGLPFWGFIILKILYTAPLGFAVTRWVIVRQLVHCRATLADKS